MRKIIGTINQYYDQTNDAQVELIKDYTGQIKMIACGPNSAVMCADIAGNNMDVFTSGTQRSDILLMILHNPHNLKYFKITRDLDYDFYPPNEVPQLYPAAFNLIYQKNICEFKWGLNFDIIKYAIDRGCPLFICGQFPCGGHYVSIVGYDTEKDIIIFNDPYPIQWDDKNGYNREMDMKFFNEKIDKYRIEFFKQ